MSRVALVCDWLTGVGGGEKVLLELHRLFPEAPIYTSQYKPELMDWFNDADVRTGFLQKFPLGLRRFLGPLRQWYFSHIDLSEYDLVISVTGAEAKAVRPKNGVHICYCHVPTQYYWEMYDDYVKNPGFGILNPFVRFFFKLLVRPLRKADLKAAQRPDYFVTISEYAKDMIKKYYGRESTIIYPPVELDDFRNGKDANAACPSDTLRAALAKSSCSAEHFAFASSPYYITTSRQVNWKKIDLAVKACLMTQRKLLVIGDGPEHKKLVKLAKGSNLVKFLPFMKKEELVTYLKGAKGYLFPSLEPFGIAPVEALSVGCPVIAYGKGGACDYVKNRKNGILFKEQTAKSLAEAILAFEKMKFDRKKISRGVQKFDLPRFDKEILDFVKKRGSKKREKK
ncbi:glycosyltransferase [Candidatus Saccharibacteria bacterium]|nr:glycosyltransferase [Candidatus Saccharibacteria bacterium]